MKSTMTVQAVLLALCLDLSGLPYLSAQTPTTAQNGMHPFYKPSSVPPALKRLQDPKYWVGQKKASDALMDHTWVHEPWTGNDAPYVAVRNQVEQAFARGAQPSGLVTKYETAAKSKSNNPLAQFGWAYAVRLATKSPALHGENTQDLLNSVNAALAEAPSPHTYAYDHLRYLIWLQWGSGVASHALKDMAYRLLAKDPHDFPVLMGLAGIYTQNRDKVAQQKGYVLIQKMIMDYPGRPEVYDMLGCWYYTQYMFYHDPRNYHLAMTSYQKALGMYPPQSARRGGLPQVMAFLTTRYHQISAGRP